MSNARRAVLGLTVLAAGGAAMAAARTAESRAVARWAGNFDPMAGEPTALDGEEIWVTTGDGGRLRVVRAGAMGPGPGKSRDGGGRDGDNTDGGETRPLAVLAHGITASANEWAPVARRLLAGGMTVVAYDERGHGASTVGSEGYTLDALGADLLDVLEQLAPRDAVLVGHSMGGIAVMSALAQASDVVNQARGVVLVATLAKADDHALTRLTGRVAATDLPPRLMAHDRHGRVLARSGYGATPSLSLLDGTRQNWMATPRATRAGFLNALRGFDLLGTLSRLECPAVVVCGDADRITPLAGNEAIAARLPHGSISVVAGAGHVIIKEHPDVVAGHVLRLAGLSPAVL